MAIDRMRKPPAGAVIERAKRNAHDDSLTIALRAIGEAHNLGGW
jgi:hypothetical protein